MASQVQDDVLRGSPPPERRELLYAASPRAQLTPPPQSLCALSEVD